MKTDFDLYSRANQVVLDTCAVSASLVFSYGLRFEEWPSGLDLRQLLVWLLVLPACRLLVHYFRATYRQVWKFVSFSDALELAKSTAIVSLFLFVLRLTYPGAGPLAAWIRIPISILVLEGLLSLLFMVGIRALRRILYSRDRRNAVVLGQGEPPKRVLLYGAGRAGIMLRKELETNPAFDVVGFIDDDPRKLGSVISDTRVVGAGKVLAQCVEKYHANEVIISMATASRLTLARTLAKCRHANVSAKIIPSLQELLTGQVHISQLRETRVEDVLGRESVQVLEFEQIAGCAYRGKRVLVTGAGGSIGSELVRQLSVLSPSTIAILDKDENSVYELEQELRLRKPSVVVEPLIADVRNSGRLRAILEDLRPQVIFHAAAHKHVPLMELHPCEAVMNNVGGTRNVLSLAAEFRAEQFVFISSDKAVNPANVMGATKRIGELLVQASLGPSSVRFACVRFGNVLGSRGSVVPLFQKQIAAGGPVTVTHPDVARYFMTIQEAVQLILCAGTLARRGGTYVLDMGNPRNILDLAREMILLSGLEPEKDVETIITGLRPGEKLTEELTAQSEKLLPTLFEKLSLIEARPFDETSLLYNIDRLLHTAGNNDRLQVFQILRNMDFGFGTEVIRAKARSAAAAN